MCHLKVCSTYTTIIRNISNFFQQIYCSTHIYMLSKIRYLIRWKLKCFQKFLFCCVNYEIVTEIPNIRACVFHPRHKKNGAHSVTHWLAITVIIEGNYVSHCLWKGADLNTDDLGSMLAFSFNLLDGFVDQIRSTLPMPTGLPSTIWDSIAATKKLLSKSFHLVIDFIII